MDQYTTTVDSPVGTLRLIASDVGLVAILWPQDRPGRVRLQTLLESSTHPILQQTCLQLEQYFVGDRERFDIPLDLRGTDFQCVVWQALCDIPFGQTRTYGQIAHAIGRPRAMRAVGAATGRNPVSIVVPCHRVIGADGTLTGFAGGMNAKRFLLGLEQAPAMTA